MGNDWWVTAKVPGEDGPQVNLWQVGYSDVDTAQEVDALMAGVRAGLDFPDDWVDAPGPWDLVLAPGQPMQFFRQDDETGEWVPRDGVVVHTDGPILAHPDPVTEG